MVVTLILGIAAAYILIGIAFALAFVTRGASAIDPSTHGAPWGFRLLIFPGSAALWPWLARKWVRARKLGTSS